MISDPESDAPVHSNENMVHKMHVRFAYRSGSPAGNREVSVGGESLTLGNGGW